MGPGAITRVASIVKGRLDLSIRLAVLVPPGCISQGFNENLRDAAMTWVQHLKCVFRVEIDTCTLCGGKLEMIARILVRLVEEGPCSAAGRVALRVRALNQKGQPM